VFKRQVFGLIVFLLWASLTGACGSFPSASPTERETRPVETATFSDPLKETGARIQSTCAALDDNWGKDWPMTLAILEYLTAHKCSCGEEPLLSKKYAAHFSYAVTLEREGDLDAATAQYQAAFLVNPRRAEALDALIRLDALPEPTTAACLSSSPARPDPAPDETPDISSFITARGDQLWLSGQPFRMKGVNYYPRHAPWHRFLQEADLSKMIAELDLIKQAGFNTIRVFLWYEPLFTCQPEAAIPNEAAFGKVDALFQLARQRGLKLVVTLNDLPDLAFRPLYTD
jgi:hypothetical protein